MTVPQQHRPTEQQVGNHQHESHMQSRHGQNMRHAGFRIVRFQPAVKVPFIPCDQSRQQFLFPLADMQPVDTFDRPPLQRRRITGRPAPVPWQARNHLIPAHIDARADSAAAH